MTLILIEVDMQRIKQFPVEWVPEQIDAILKPYHLKWVYGNYYGVESGYDEGIAVEGGIAALQATAWLRDALHVQVVRRVVKRKLQEIDTGAMKAPKPEKMEQCRRRLEGTELTGEKLMYPNPIVIDEENRLLDGYTTYLILKERGIEEAMCVLEPLSQS